jgi:amino acid adenylation domain-containing protein
MDKMMRTSYPLSSGQKAMWLLYKIAPESVAYNIFITTKINSFLNIPTVTRVWEKIVQNHPILRTTYTVEDAQPVQQINQEPKFTVDIIDARNWSEEDLKEKIYAITDRPFNLETDSVLRVNLLTCSEKEHILLLTMHHIAGDMWSFDLLLSEFQSLYVAEIASQEPTENVGDCLSNNNSYENFVRWQSEMLSGSRGEKHWQYWQKKLAGELPILNLLPDKPRPPLPTYQGKSHFLKLNNQLVKKLKNLAITSGKSLYKVLLTAFYIEIDRYTNQKDIIIGSPMRGRWGREFKEIVGYFSNLIPLRVSLEENATFTECLEQVSKTVREGQKYQAYPFSLLAEQLQPQRDPSRPPLCQVSFTLQSHRWCESRERENSLPNQAQKLAMEPYLIGHQRGADFDLNLVVIEAQGILKLCWQYNTDLFEAATIERMAGHFVNLLEAIVDNPQQQICQLPLLTEVEKQQLLVEWNDTQTEYPQDKCIHQLFEEAVERTPNAIAIVYENQTLTYCELNARANQLAHYLQSLGVVPDTLVGICVERSPNMIIAILAILKAGGAYVPLDPSYLSQRLQFMVEDAGFEILLTQTSLLPDLPAHPPQIVCLDRDGNAIASYPTENPHSLSTTNNLAYVIYTSGSTGQPKGVMVEQGSLTNFIQAAQQTYGIEASDRVLQFASISFDAAAEEIYTTLIGGATLVLRNDATAGGLTPFLRLCRDWQLTVLDLPTAYWQQLVAECVHTQQSWPMGIRLMIIGGEQVGVESVRLWQQIVQKQSATPRLLNTYGPTETTVVATTYMIPSSPEAIKPDQAIAIGKPLSNVMTYVLDAQQQLVPVGVPGELHIGGAGVARGYLNRPELTSEKFIPNPFDKSKVKSQKSKLYKTGDLARYLPDGNIEFLGRIDNQVKIRGFRVELGEIEAILSQRDDVQTACVISREDIPGNQLIVAYIVAQPEPTPDISKLRQFLEAKLPAYMVPNAFVILESLPLTPNGKIDRRALPVPDLTQQTQEYIAPRTPVEEILTQIWSQVLNVESVGINDNFFELGGHSLLATQLVSRIRNSFEVELPLRQLFATATIAQLADSIGQLQQQNPGLTVPPILPRQQGSELSLSYAQQRLWFIDQLQPNSALYNIPIALRLEGSLNSTALEQSLIEIISRHEALRTNFITVDGEATQVIHSQINSILSVVNLTDLSIAEQEIKAQQIATNQANNPFNLVSDPLIRSTLVVLSEKENWLLLCMHHIVSDGWSMGVLVEELAILYKAYCQGKPSPLTSLPIQYADFAIWQREWLQGDVLENQLSYWKDQLANAPELLSLPTDRPRLAVQTFVGTHQEFTLSNELTKKLIQLSQQQGVTLFMTLLAAFDTLLYRYSGQSDILVGTPIANRNQSEIEGLIGFFVNTLVMRTDLSGNPSFNELLGSVRLMTMAAYSHQDLPFEMLVEALQPERDLSYTPLFQVMFSLQNQTDVDLTGLTVNRLQIDRKTSKFDLTLSMENTANGLAGVWEYNTDLFDASTIERMTSHWITLLEAIVANPQERIAQLPLLSEVEQHQLLIEWNNTQIEYPQDKCIHQLFKEIVEQTPNAVAIVYENQTLTYCELNTSANQLAHYLQSLGVVPDTLVGICLERSIDMIVGILAILKAGGAYVSLDPDYPSERLSFIVEDAQLSVILTQQKLLESLPQHQARIVCLESDKETITQSSQSNPINTTTANNLAYIIYTSGSTGQPKGVKVNHSNVVRLFSATESWYHFNSSDVWTLFHSIAFDFSVWEIWGALLYGGKLVIVPYLVSREPESFYQLLCQENVTVLNQTPSAFRQLIQAEEGIENDLNLRLVIFGGEALELNSLKPWFERHGDTKPQLVNMYGITETTVHVTYRPLSIRDLDGAASVIGRPIPDLQMYVLDEYLQPVPIGVAGEMYVGGAGVTRGYLNRDELTIERFISNPFNNSKLYKTGDLARYLPNGELEYLGRIDNQVKIRGFRIELGEIEALLTQYRDVWETVVLVREDEPGDKRLVAYVVPKSESSLTLAELRQFLEAKLPAYMVPNVFVILESLPLTNNGKINRRALPKPDLSSRQHQYIAPRTPTEEMLVQIWAQVLKVEKVGINDNFFELGGHSLLATQLISKIRKVLQVELPLKEVFSAATVAQLADSIEQLKQRNSEVTKPRILPRRRKRSNTS